MGWGVLMIQGPSRVDLRVLPENTSDSKALKSNGTFPQSCD